MIFVVFFWLRSNLEYPILGNVVVCVLESSESDLLTVRCSGNGMIDPSLFPRWVVSISNLAENWVCPRVFQLPVGFSQELSMGIHPLSQGFIFPTSRVFFFQRCHTGGFFVCQWQIRFTVLVVSIQTMEGSLISSLNIPVELAVSLPWKEIPVLSVLNTTFLKLHRTF